MIIDASWPHPHVANIIAPGTGPEGISANGKWAVTPLIEGSGAKPGAWNYTKGSLAALMAIEPGGHLILQNKAPIGTLPEGVALSPNSEYVSISN